MPKRAPLGTTKVPSIVRVVIVWGLFWAAPPWNGAERARPLRARIRESRRSYADCWSEAGFDEARGRPALGRRARTRAKEAPQALAARARPPGPAGSRALGARLRS